MLELWAEGFVEYFISTCVGEMPPSDTSTDSLAHLQEARQMRACAYEHRFHYDVLWAASMQTIVFRVATVSPLYIDFLQSGVSNNNVISLF